MTEYELADLFISWGNFLESTVERFVALLFAFLIAAYLVSAKLQRVIVGIVLALYSYMALRYAFFHLNVAGDQIALARQIMEIRAQPDSSLGWLEISPIISILLYSQAVAMFLSYLASIAFFFYTRHNPTRQEPAFSEFRPE